MSQETEKTLEYSRAYKNFYRDWYRKTMAALLVMIVVVLSLLVGVIYMGLYNPEVRYFASVITGELYLLRGTDTP